MKNLSKIFPLTRENYLLGMHARRKFLKERSPYEVITKKVQMEDTVRWARK